MAACRGFFLCSIVPKRLVAATHPLSLASIQVSSFSTNSQSVQSGNLKTCARQSLHNFYLFVIITLGCIHEVTPRDGLQNEKRALKLDQKVNLVKNLVEADFKSIELCSFVREDLVPQMAGSLELCTHLAGTDWIAEAKQLHTTASSVVSFSALVPNLRGFETLCKVNDVNGQQGFQLLDTVCILTSCTESHSKANVNMTMSEALLRNETIVAAAKDKGVAVRAYASLAFGCPFEGDVDPKAVDEIVSAYLDWDVEFLVLADTFGHATPQTVKKLLDYLASNSLKKLAKTKSEVGKLLGFHMHDANGLAAENIKLGIEDYGVRNFDAAIGGCGGCSFIEGAEGNIATEKLVSLLNTLNISHGLDEHLISKANHDLEKALKRKLKHSIEKG